MKTYKDWHLIAPVLFADVAILDATFTENLPRHISAATGISDAMVHAIEAYTSKIKKPLCRHVSKAGFKTAESKPQFGAKKMVEKFRSSTNMLVGSTMAGQAFANAL